MQSSPLSHIKKELQHLNHAALVALCYRLIQYKRENKDLVHYLLFEQQDEKGFRKKLCTAIDDLFAEVNQNSIYFAKKTIRKIIRFMHRYLKFSNDAVTGIEVILHFCRNMQALSLRWHESKVMNNLYQQQIKKATQMLKSLHEDLQYDYSELIAELQ